MVSDLTIPNPIWRVWRKPDSKNVAIQHERWQRPMYCPPDEAQALMAGIAECLQLPIPKTKIQVAKGCRSEKDIAPAKTVRCQYDSHFHGHMHRWIDADGRFTITWSN